MEIGDTITPSEYQLYPKSIDEALQWWDEGRTVFTIEMGGIGPGYEQCIQITMFELLRARDKWRDADKDKLDEAMNSVMFASDTVKELGITGAMAGAAKNLAYLFEKHPWGDAMKKAPEDRHIQVSKNFPGA